MTTSSFHQTTIFRRHIPLLRHKAIGAEAIMTQVSQALTISLLLLLVTSHTSSGSFQSSHKSGASRGREVNEIIVQEDDFSSLIGLEECGEKDEGCHKRRMVAEAHLDYIYTQHQKP